MIGYLVAAAGAVAAYLYATNRSEERAEDAELRAAKRAVDAEDEMDRLRAAETIFAKEYPDRQTLVGARRFAAGWFESEPREARAFVRRWREAKARARARR